MGAATIVSPLELVRTKMQSQKMPIHQVRTCIKGLVASQGVLSLWNGYTATLLRDVPFSAIYWPLYEQTRKTLHSIYPAESSNSFPINFASGAVAGSVASTITLPFDVLKTTKQIEIGERDIMQVQRAVMRSNNQIVRDIL